MKKKLVFSFLSLLAIAIIYGSYQQFQKQKERSEALTVTLEEADFGNIGEEPQKWTEDLATVREIFQSFDSPDMSKGPTEQIANIPPEINVLGAALQAMRAQAMSDAEKANQLSLLLIEQAKRPDLFLPIRALAYTHLALLAKGGNISINNNDFDSDVIELSKAVLANP